MRRRGQHQGRRPADGNPAAWLRICFAGALLPGDAVGKAPCQARWNAWGATLCVDTRTKPSCRVSEVAEERRTPDASRSAQTQRCSQPLACRLMRLQQHLGALVQRLGIAQATQQNLGCWADG